MSTGPLTNNCLRHSCFHCKTGTVVVPACLTAGLQHHRTTGQPSAPCQHGLLCAQCHLVFSPAAWGRGSGRTLATVSNNTQENSKQEKEGSSEDESKNEWNTEENTRQTKGVSLQRSTKWTKNKREKTEMLKSGRERVIAAPSLQKHTHSSKSKPKLCTHRILLPSALPAPGGLRHHSCDLRWSVKCDENGMGHFREPGCVLALCSFLLA